jgi:hypothetical protein
MIVWQPHEPPTEPSPDRETRIAFLIACNLCAAAAIFVTFFPKLAEEIWK